MNLFIREIQSRFQNFQVSVEIDPKLLPELDCDDKTSTNRLITFNLYKLIYSIGLIQTRRSRQSKRMKFIDKSDLIERIYSDTNFRIKINEIRADRGSEILGSISEDFGVGISIVIAEKLFNIEFSTIQRVFGNQKRPDWKCQTKDNRILVVESKGSSSLQTSLGQTDNALIQKTKATGDIKIASLTLINEDEISTNRFLDPPIRPSDYDSEMENKILRAGHYSSIFSFLGNVALSRYYIQMRKRLMRIITEKEQIEKNNMFFQLRDIYPNISFEESLFTGTFYRVDKERFIFIGVDKKLISYQGFLAFEDYPNEVNKTINNNNFMLFQDGILIIEIFNIKQFSNVVNIERIRNYQENITITDVDEMTHLSFEKYVVYLLKKFDFEVNQQQRIDNFIADAIGVKDDQKYLFEMKLSKSKKIGRNVIPNLSKLLESSNLSKVVLITNAIVQKERFLENNNLIIIDRIKLRKLLYNNEILLNLLGIIKPNSEMN